MRERRGRTKVKVLQNRDRETLEKETRENITKGSVVYTDEHKGYMGLIDSDFEHGTVNHSAKEFVNMMASTNSMESVWAVVKRSIIGTYHHVSKKHLHRYVDESSFCLTEEDVKNLLMDRNSSLCSKMAGRVLPYKNLIAV